MHVHLHCRAVADFVARAVHFNKADAWCIGTGVYGFGSLAHLFEHGWSAAHRRGAHFVVEAPCEIGVAGGDIARAVAVPNQRVADGYRKVICGGLVFADRVMRFGPNRRRCTAGVKIGGPHHRGCCAAVVRCKGGVPQPGRAIVIAVEHHDEPNLVVTGLALPRWHIYVFAGIHRCGV